VSGVRKAFENSHRQAILHETLVEVRDVATGMPKRQAFFRFGLLGSSSWLLLLFKRALKLPLLDMTLEKK